MENRVSTPPSSSLSEANRNENSEEDNRPLSPPLPPQQKSHSNQIQPEEFTCEICIEPMANQLFKNGSKCAHPFCTECVIKYIEAKLDDNIATIPCPALDCSEFIDPFVCSELGGPELFVRWCDALCDKVVMNFSRSYCPNRTCSALIVNECGGNVKKAVCPNCKRPFCFECKLPWHAGFRCDESGIPRDQNDRAFGALVERKNWKRCPRCQHFVELVQGCKIVKCRCHASFCYKCGRQVHQHWCGCDATYECCNLCYRLFVIFIFAFALLLLGRAAILHD